MTKREPFEKITNTPDGWGERLERLRLPFVLEVESALPLGNSVKRIRELENAKAGLFAPEWRVTLLENSEGLPFKVEIIRQNTQRSRASRKYTSVIAEGLIRRDVTRNKTILNGVIKFGSEALIVAILATLATVIPVVIWFIIEAQNDFGYRGMGEIVVWIVVLIVLIILWGRLFWDRHQMRQTLERLLIP